MRPVLWVTNLVAPDRAGAFRALARRVDVELALFGGRSHHATGGVEDPGVPHRHVRQRDVLRLAGSGRYGAVVCGTAGRVALPAALAGAARARVPFVLWSALWADLETPAHRAARPLLALAHRRSALVLAYGPHVAEHARRRGARRVVLAPQAVDQAFWSRAAAGAGPPTREQPGLRAAFVGRDAPGKGLEVLLEAWDAAAGPDDELLVVGSERPGDPRFKGAATPERVRNFLVGCDVLVVPSVPTPAFREPWGLVCNEAMHLELCVLASDAVGAVRGGLVVDGRNGLVHPAGDAQALAADLRRVREDPALRRRMGRQGAQDAAPYTQDAWADAVAAALRDLRT